MLDKEEFVDELSAFVKSEIERVGDMEYCNEAIEIVDARNGIIRNVGTHVTDEEMNIVRLKDLCMMNEMMQFEVNSMKIRRIARHYFD